MFFRVGLASKGFKWEHRVCIDVLVHCHLIGLASTVWVDLNTTVSQLVRCVCSTVDELLEREGNVQ